MYTSVCTQDLALNPVIFHFIPFLPHPALVAYIVSLTIHNRPRALLCVIM